MKTQFEKLREKINEARNEIKKEKGELSYVFNKALESVLITMDEIEEKEIKLGDNCFFWSSDEKSFCYAKLIEIDIDDTELPFKAEISCDGHWYEFVSKEIPKHLINPLNN
jgi:hypothetical protein